MTTASTLTKREQETFDAIKAKGKSGADFNQLRTELNVRADSTLRPRLAKLAQMGKIKVERQADDARKVKYFAVKA